MTAIFGEGEKETLSRIFDDGMKYRDLNPLVFSSSLTFEEYVEKAGKKEREREGKTRLLTRGKIWSHTDR